MSIVKANYNYRTDTDRDAYRDSKQLSNIRAWPIDTINPIPLLEPGSAEDETDAAHHQPKLQHRPQPGGISAEVTTPIVIRASPLSSHQDTILLLHFRRPAFHD